MIIDLLKNEFKLLANVFKTYLPPEYPYDVVGAARTVKATDFDITVETFNLVLISSRYSLGYFILT